MKFADFVDEVSPAYPEFKGLSHCNNLDVAFRFLTSIGFAIAQMDLVSQDEFTLDVVFPFPDKNKFLVLGVT